jgi:hypothetical protein
VLESKSHAAQAKNRIYHLSVGYPSDRLESNPGAKSGWFSDLMAGVKSRSGSPGNQNAFRHGLTGLTAVKTGRSPLPMRQNSLLDSKKKLAEREGFEPPSRFPVNLISSQAPSTGLGHLSMWIQLVSRFRRLSQFLCRHGVNIFSP